MSMWTPPGTPVAQEYPQGRVESNGLQRLVNMVTDLRRELRESTSNLFSTAGIFLSKTGMRIASALTVEGDLISTGSADITGTTHIGGATDIDGTLNVDAATTIGGTLGVTGATTLGSTLALAGTGTVSGLLQSSNFVAGVSGWRLTSTGLEVNTLTAKDAIIGNAALVNPVMPAPLYERADGWATTTTLQTKVTETLTTPAGFTKALVSASAWATATNTTGVTDNMYVRPVINGAAGSADYISGITPGASGSGQASDSQLVSGLTPGQTFTITAEVRTGNAWAASAGNIAIINGTVLWFR